LIERNAGGASKESLMAIVAGLVMVLFAIVIYTAYSATRSAAGVGNLGLGPLLVVNWNKFRGALDGEIGEPLTSIRPERPLAASVAAKIRG
jgi:hypothetical protein